MCACACISCAVHYIYISGPSEEGGGGGGGGELGLRHTANVNLFPSIKQTRAIIDCKPPPET